MGRDSPPQGADDSQPPGDGATGHCAPGCGCRAGQPVPCGADLAVHVPLGGALGTTDEPAEVAGHGPLEPDLLAVLLLAAPRLRPVWVGPDGTPVAAGDQVVVPRRDDPQSVREALLALAGLPPPALQPRHPRDHPPPHQSHDQPPDHPPDHQADHLPVGQPREPSPPPDVGIPHPPASPGRYRPPRWLRRLLHARAPRCEWPGCGARAVRCDAEHDRAWPGGPTCACNLGPCCRRHHQVKQHGWTKTRTPDGVRWTARTGRSWLSPSQHPPPSPALRPLPPTTTTNPLDELSPGQLEDELAALDLLPPDDWTSHRLLEDTEPADEDSLGRRLQHESTRWTLDLDDPYPWLDLAPADVR